MRALVVYESMWGNTEKIARAVAKGIGGARTLEVNAVSDADLEGHARPLLHVVALAGEVDAGDAADAPLRIRQATRVAMHHRVVGDARAERIVLLALGVGLLLALLWGTVRAGLLTRAALPAGRPVAAPARVG